MKQSIKIAALLGIGVFLIGLGLSFFIPVDLIGLLCLSIIITYVFWMIDHYNPGNYRLGVESITLLILAPAWLLYQGFDPLLAIVALCITAALCHLLVANHTLEIPVFHQTAFFVWSIIGGILSIYQSLIAGTWGIATFLTSLAIILLGFLKTENGNQIAEKIIIRVKPSRLIQKLIEYQNWILLSVGILGVLFTISVFLELQVLEWLVIDMRKLVYILMRNWQNSILFFLIPLIVLIEPLKEENETIANNLYYRKVLAVVFGLFFIGMIISFIFLSNYDSNPYANWWGVTPTEKGEAALKAWQALLCVGVSFSYPLLASTCKSPLGRALFFIVCCVLEIAQLIWFLTY
ncbi:MAG: hypothetical protein ACFFC7_34575 [Candidatus Hermodarchaeota archaeon]